MTRRGLRVGVVLAVVVATGMAGPTVGGTAGQTTAVVEVDVQQLLDDFVGVAEQGDTPGLAGSGAELERLYEAYGLWWPDSRLIPNWQRWWPPIDFTREAALVFHTFHEAMYREELGGVEVDGTVVTVTIDEIRKPGGGAMVSHLSAVVAVDRAALPLGPIEVRLVRELLGTDPVGTETFVLGPPPRDWAGGQPLAMEVLRREVVGWEGRLDRPMAAGSVRQARGLWGRRGLDRDGQMIEPHPWGELPEVDYARQVLVVVPGGALRDRQWRPDGARVEAGGLRIDLAVDRPGGDRDEVHMWVLAVDREALPTGEMRAEVVGPGNWRMASSLIALAAPPGSATRALVWWLVGLLAAGGVLALLLGAVVRARRTTAGV